MKNCTDMNRLMTPYVDGEVTTADRQAIDAHLAVCPRCCARADAERSARRIVRAQASTLTRPAPATLRARCAAVVPSDGIPVQRAGVGRRVRQWVSLSLATTVLLAVAGVFMAGQQERLEASFVAQLAIDHDKCFAEFGTGHPRLDVAQVEARLAPKYGLDISVPASADGADLDLVDVRFCDYDGGSMAHLLYEVAGQPVSLFVIPAVDHAERSLEVMGLQARLWSNDAAACVLVGRENVALMDKVAAYMRSYEE